MEAVRFTDSVVRPSKATGYPRRDRRELTSYERAAEAPIVDVGLSDSSDGRTDWFDLAVTVSVGGEQVPFEGLFGRSPRVTRPSAGFGDVVPAR